MHNSFSFARAGVLLLLGATGLMAAGTGPYTAQSLVPAVDSWMYPHAGSPGTRTTASTFTALPAPASTTGVEDRFAQFIIKFNTVAAGIPAGLGVENYDLSRIALTCVIASGDIPYDPTEDPRSSYVAGGKDPDAGRPLEVHGTGFRSSATAANYTESSAFGSSAVGGRNAYALGYSPAAVARDVSHNVTAGFDALPWGIAKILVMPQGASNWSPLTPGANIPVYAHAVFELNLALPGVANYVKASLNQGYIWLTVTSLHSTSEMAASGYPAYFTKENPEQALFGDVAASLDVTYSLPVKVIAFSRNQTAQTASITWNGSPGFKYHVERSETLQTGSWTSVANYTPTSAASITWAGSSPSPRSFYRISRIIKP